MPTTLYLQKSSDTGTSKNLQQPKETRLFENIIMKFCNVWDKIAKLKNLVELANEKIDCFVSLLAKLSPMFLGCFDSFCFPRKCATSSQTTLVCSETGEENVNTRHDTVFKNFLQLFICETVNCRDFIRRTLYMRNKGAKSFNKEVHSLNNNCWKRWRQLLWLISMQHWDS